MTTATESLEDSAPGVKREKTDGSEQRPAVRLQVNDRDLQTLYANAFRLNSSADELFLDLGINTITAANKQPGQDSRLTYSRAQLRFDISHRVVLNYYTAKRLAMVLGNLVRQHEQRFGELKLDVADRLASDHTTTAD